MLRSPLFQSIYETKRLTQKSHLLQYLNRMNIGNKLYLIDIGWKGTMQNCIYQLYHEQREITGFYFGQFHSREYLYTEKNNNRKSGLIINFNMDTDKADTVSTVYGSLNTLIYEIIASCADGSVYSLSLIHIFCTQLFQAYRKTHNHINITSL